MLMLPAFTHPPKLNHIHNCDALTLLRAMPSESVNCIVTSPPYFGLRDYGVDGQIGLEETPEQFVAALVSVFREARRALRNDGTLWLNLGDSYSGSGKGRLFDGSHSETSAKQVTNKGAILGDLSKSYVGGGIKPKDMIGIPWMVAFALRADGWYLRSDIIWHKPNPMPESVTDRPTKSHEYVFLLTKSASYWYDADAIKEDAVEGNDLGLLRGRGAGVNDKVAWHAPSIKKRQDAGVDSYSAGTGKRNKRTVWTIATQPYKEAHFATFPPDLIEPMILAGCPTGGVVLDPFMGSGTTARVAVKLGRQYVGSELNYDYACMGRDSLRKPFEKVLRKKASSDLSDLPMFAA